MPRSYIQYCRSLEIQLPGTLFVTIFEWFLLQSGRLKQARTIETARWDLVKGDRDRLIIEVKITITKEHNFRDFDN